MTAVEPSSDQRFRKSDRLLRRPDFVRVQTTGEKFRSKRVLIAWTPSTAGTTRIGVTVSRKVGNSPTRARVKRWIREAFRTNKDAWPAGVDFVVIARPPAARSDFWKIRGDMLRWADEQARRTKGGQ